MPRRSAGGLPAVTWKINVDRQIALRVEFRLRNLSGTKPQYGARSDLIESLLRDWLVEQDNFALNQETSSLVEHSG